MKMTTASVISVLKVVAIFTVFIAGFYTVVIPVFFPNYKTYSILIVGTAIAALIGGYIGYKAAADDTVFFKIFIGSCYAATGAVLVLLLSLLVILNVRGS